MHSYHQSSENFLREILFVVFAQKRLIIDLFIYMLIGLLLITVFSQNEYTGQATLLVKGKRIERNPESIQQTQIKVLPISREDLSSEVQILLSQALLKSVVLAADKQYATFGGGLETDTLDSIENNLQDVDVSKAMSELALALNINVIPSSKLIELSVKWSSAIEAKQVLSILIEKYFIYRNMVYQPEKTRDFYEETVQSYQEKIDKQEILLLKVVNQIKASNSKQEIESNLALKKDYQHRLSTLEQSRLDLQADIIYINQQISHNSQNITLTKPEQAIKLFSKIDNLSIRQLSNAVQSKLIIYLNASGHFREDSHKVTVLKRELERANSTLINEVRLLAEHNQNQLNSVNEMIVFLSDKIDKLVVRNTSLAQLQIELDTLRRDKELLEQSFSNYYKLREESIMSERTHSANLNTQVALITPAWAEEEPTFPNYIVLIPFGIFIALLVSLTAGFINEYFDDTIKRPNDSMRLIGVPALISLSDLHPSKQAYFEFRLISFINYLKNKRNKNGSAANSQNSDISNDDM